MIPSKEQLLNEAKSFCDHAISTGTKITVDGDSVIVSPIMADFAEKILRKYTNKTSNIATYTVTVLEEGIHDTNPIFHALRLSGINVQSVCLTDPK